MRSNLAIFDEWWNYSRKTDRPMLFPQVMGHTSGKFFYPISKDRYKPLFFSFGLVNVEKEKKILIDIENINPLYINNGNKQKKKTHIAKENGWIITKLSVNDINNPKNCIDKLKLYIFY